MACTRPVLALTALLGILSIPALASARWTRVAREGRVTVFVEEDAGRDVPRFKGVSVIDGTIPHIMAILSDADRACEWNRACVENRVLERSDGWHFVFYNRLRSPWPVSDRDAVMRSEVRVYDGGKRVVASFRALHRARPAAPSGVVRFERLYGHYELRAMPRRATLVSYVIDADPGGWVPGWVVRYVIRNVPIGTLQGLQRQVRRTAGKYRARIGAQRALFGRARAAPSSVGPVKHLDRRLTDPGAISTGRGGRPSPGALRPARSGKTSLSKALPHPLSRAARRVPRSCLGTVGAFVSGSIPGSDRSLVDGYWPAVAPRGRERSRPGRSPTESSGVRMPSPVRSRRTGVGGELLANADRGARSPRGPDPPVKNAEDPRRR